MIGDAIAHAMVMAMVVVAIVTALIVLFVVFGIPWLWTLVKPWIHMLSA